MKTLPERIRSLVLEVYRASADFPEETLREQLRAYGGALERAEDVDVANGKLAATASLLLLSRDLGYLSSTRWRVIRRLVEAVGKKLGALALEPKAGPRGRVSRKRA